MKLLALGLLLAAACSAPGEEPALVASSASTEPARPAEAPGPTVRTSLVVCTDAPMVLAAMAEWSRALPPAPSPHGPGQPPVPALRAFCGTEHELGHALGLPHLARGIMAAHELEGACVDADAAALLPGAVPTCP